MFSAYKIWLKLLPLYLKLKISLIGNDTKLMYISFRLMLDELFFIDLYRFEYNFITWEIKTAK